VMKAIIVGCGGIAQVHAKVLSFMPSVQLVGCADIRMERAQALAGQYGINAYTSLEEMLARESADVLHICTPHYLHVPMAVQGLQNHLHVFMEKPPAISAEQIKQLKEQLKLSCTQLGVCFQNRYNPSVQQVRHEIASGAMGKVLGARAFVTWKREEPYYTESGWRGTWETEGGGVLINQSIHTLDLLRYFLGEPDLVEGTVKNHHLKGIIQVEDTAEAYFRFGDIPVLFYATTAYCTDAPVLLEFACEKAVIRIENERVQYCYSDGRMEEKNLHFSSVSSGYGKDYWGNGHQACISDFYRCIESGEKAPISLEDASCTLKMMLGIYESSKQGKTVPLVDSLA
jgi:UDP-N-acetyl-2-amino-2-deoxyglucuronate dehydrogenase